jgi:hypothetical protein
VHLSAARKWKRIEEAGKPLPKLIRLGTLREIIDALNLDTGGKTSRVMLFATMPCSGMARHSEGGSVRFCL